MMANEKKQTITIGELAKKSGLRTSALRYYEEQGLLQPEERTESGYRLYGEGAEDTLHFIQRAQRLGFSLQDIRVILQGYKKDKLSQEEFFNLVNGRYLSIEKRVTEDLALRHEMGLLLQDLSRLSGDRMDQSARMLLDDLIVRVCSNPLNHPTNLLDWIFEYSGCPINSPEGRTLLEKLKGQHIHIWQERNGYSILIVSQEKGIESALLSLIDMEKDCGVHLYQELDLDKTDEGFLISARGENAFIFARLFLMLENNESL